ncbi:MAG: hypothetical protein K0S20_541 [Patescibacteria group bacterium]|jgi:RNA recognition motif-containing protein|nr:hypothetical protein [Patescibacteria group bacterium]
MEQQFKVFVGNLPYSISEATLKQVFMEIGGFEEDQITEVIILKEKNPNDPSRPPRSRGIGFVGFTTKEAMEQAIEKVNSTEVEYEVRGEVMKRPIFVNEARPYIPRDQRPAQQDEQY